MLIVDGMLLFVELFQNKAQLHYCCLFASAFMMELVSRKKLGVVGLEIAYQDCYITESFFSSHTQKSSPILVLQSFYPFIITCLSRIEIIAPEVSPFRSSIAFFFHPEIATRLFRLHQQAVKNRFLKIYEQRRRQQQK